MPLDRRFQSGQPWKAVCRREPARRFLGVLTIVLSLVAALAAPALLRAQEETAVIGIDADPSGNSATRLGTIDSCVEVTAGSTFQVDLFVRDVTDLLAWEAYLETDPLVVEILDRDVQLFQAANPGSDVLDGSEVTPDDDGLYRLSAVDTADPQAPDSGSGVLARITLEAVGTGVSPLRLPHRDLDDDGTPDQGPFLRDVDADVIGDETGDTFFDGPIANARVAVHRGCPAGGDDGLNPLIIIGPVVGGIAAITLAALATAYTRRRRGSAG